MEARGVADLRSTTRLRFRRLTLPFLAATLCAIIAAPAAAQTPAGMRADLAAEQDDDTPHTLRPSDAFPLNGDLRIDNTVGLGTFVPGEARRASYDLGLFLRVGLMLGRGATLGALQTVSKNLATNADSGATRPYDTLVGDTLLTASWTPSRDDENGKTKPLLLPGGIRFSASLMAALPTSRASRFQTRILALTPGVSLIKADLFAGKLMILYAFGVTKNFNRLTTTAVDAANFPSLARPDGPEWMSGQSEIATGTLNTAFALRNTLAVTWQPSARLAIGLTYVLYNNFKYNDFAADNWTSSNAKPGRGRSDVQWGLVSAGYTFDPAQKWTLSLMALTAAPPWSADNQTLRFPFLDFRSTADNYTSFSLSVNRAF